MQVSSQVQWYSYGFTFYYDKLVTCGSKEEEVKEEFRSNKESRQRTDGYDNVKAEWEGESGITEGIKTRLS